MENIMTLEEAAKYLKIAKPTLYRLLEDGKIPAFKVGNQWRFTRDLINQWLWNQIPKEKRALVVDDEELICMDLNNIIFSEGHRVISVNTGTEAITLIQENTFDLVFLDLSLDDVSGVDVLKKIRETQPDLLVVIITGYPDSDLMNEALELGPISVIKKPFTKKQIRSLLKLLTTPASGDSKGVSQI